MMMGWGSARPFPDRRDGNRMCAVRTGEKRDCARRSEAADRTSYCVPSKDGLSLSFVLIVSYS